MKRVGILNFQYSTHNYGAVLQAAALEHICRQLDHDPQHLDFMPARRTTLKGRLGQVLRKTGLRRSPKADQCGNEEAFERFREAFINRTARIQSAQAFLAAAKGYDAVVVGSDQVWRPEFAQDTTAFFLGYVPNGVDRIAYAASFGTATWEHADDTALTAKVREALARFKAVSCREDSGVAICKAHFGVDAAHVLDPLLLVDDGFLERVAARAAVNSPATLVYYKLDSSPDFQSDLNRLSSEFGSRAVNLYTADAVRRGYREVADWLALAYGADVVVSDSFHGICLALRCGKEVIYCPNQKRGQARLDSLFKQLAIDLEPLPWELKTPMFRLVRRGDVDSILSSARAHSLSFLADALDG